MKFEYKLVLAYLVIGALWIVFSDKILILFINDIETLAIYQTYKGWFYVAATALIFFLILKRYLENQRSIDNKLKLNEKKLYAILNHHFQLTGLIATDGQLLMANRKVLEFSDVAETDVIGKLFWDCPWWKGVDIQEVKKAFEQAARGEFVRIDTYHSNHKGELRKMDFSFNPVKDDEGNVIYIVPEGRDITEINEAEESLQESEERFRAIFSNATDGIILHSTNLKEGITHCNEAAYKILGYNSSKELIGKTILDISPEFQAKNIKSHEIGEKHIEDCLKNGQTRFEWVHLKKDNSQILFDIILTKITFSGRVYIHSLWRDITDKKKAEAELIQAKLKAEEGEKKVIHYQEIAKLGGWELDVATGIFTFNDSFYKIFHTTAEEVGGYQMTAEEYAKKFVHPDEITIVANHIEKSIESEDPNFSNYVEHRILYADGGIGYIGVRYFIQKDEKGKTIKTFGVNQDITEKKKTELELIKAKEKAEESGRLKTAFLLNMSHEIRTPMNGILGFIELLKQRDLEEQERLKFINIVNKSGERLMDTINDIIEISRIEIGDVKLNYSSVNVHELMQYYYDFFRIEAEHKGVELKITAQLTGDQTNIETDKSKLDGIMINLIKNAIKFTEKGKIEIGNYLKNGNLWFYVTDTGRGIPKDKIDVIFDRFVQADHSLSRGYEGSGIGLSIVKGYVEAMNGSIELESEVGKGSTFKFYIPYNPSTK